MKEKKTGGKTKKKNQQKKPQALHEHSWVLTLNCKGSM